MHAPGAYIQGHAHPPPCIQVSLAGSQQLGLLVQGGASCSQPLPQQDGATTVCTPNVPAEGEPAASLLAGHGIEGGEKEELQPP